MVKDRTPQEQKKINYARYQELIILLILKKLTREKNFSQQYQPKFFSQKLLFKRRKFDFSIQKDVTNYYIEYTIKEKTKNKKETNHLKFLCIIDIEDNSGIIGYVKKGKEVIINNNVNSDVVCELLKFCSSYFTYAVNKPMIYS